MSEKTELSDEEKLAAARGVDIDPLLGEGEVFEETGVDPFEFYKRKDMDPTLSQGTLYNHETAFQDWKEHMEDKDRHYACPNEDHVKGFIRHLREDKGNQNGTVKRKLQYINSAFQYWQRNNLFPHKQDYNPIELAKGNINLKEQQKKPIHPISVEELGGVVGEVKNLMHRAIIVSQLKLGLRAGEVCNIQLQDINISHENLEDHYPDIGTHREVKDRPNSIYIPSREKREGNKSTTDRVLPLDDEVRRVLIDYLLIRPDGMDEPWIFLTTGDNIQLRVKQFSDIWKPYFHPEYAETEQYREITSHFGRHYFTTYWRVTQDMNEKYVQYMRGDSTENSPGSNGKSITSYLHTYYEDIEEEYRDSIYRLYP